MANKVTFVISGDAEQETKLTIHHVKYQKNSYLLSPGGNIVFDSFINWDKTTFRISSENEVLIKDIKYTLKSSGLQKIKIYEQKINDIDLFPRRTNYENLLVYHFVPMIIKSGDIGVIRFSTSLLTLSS